MYKLICKISGLTLKIYGKHEMFYQKTHQIVLVHYLYVDHMLDKVQAADDQFLVNSS